MNKRLSRIVTYVATFSSVFLLVERTEADFVSPYSASSGITVKASVHAIVNGISIDGGATATQDLLVRIDLVHDSISQTQYAAAHTLLNLGDVKANGLAFVQSGAGGGPLGTLIWSTPKSFTPATGQATTHTSVVEMHKLDLSSPSLSPSLLGSFVYETPVNGGTAANQANLSGGAWNSNPDLFEGVGYYGQQSNYNNIHFVDLGPNIDSVVGTSILPGAGSLFAPTLDLEFIDDNLIFSSAGSTNNPPGNERVGLAIYNADGTFTQRNSNLFTQLSYGSDGEVYVGGNSGAAGDETVFGPTGNAYSRSRIAQLDLSDYSLGHHYQLTQIDGGAFTGNANIKDLSSAMSYSVSAVPEPGTMALLGFVGLGGLFGRLRARKSKS